LLPIYKSAGISTSNNGTFEPRVSTPALFFILLLSSITFVDVLKVSIMSDYFSLSLMLIDHPLLLDISAY